MRELIISEDKLLFLLMRASRYDPLVADGLRKLNELRRRSSDAPTQGSTQERGA